jgi:hypothetical protein
MGITPQEDKMHVPFALPALNVQMPTLDPWYVLQVRFRPRAQKPVKPVQLGTRVLPTPIHTHFALRVPIPKMGMGFVLSVPRVKNVPTISKLVPIVSLPNILPVTLLTVLNALRAMTVQTPMVQE